LATPLRTAIAAISPRSPKQSSLTAVRGASRDAFNALPQNQQAAIVEFLNTLQVLPEGGAALVVDNLGRAVDKQALALRLAVQPGQ
jgi:hypothetical protein